MIHPELGDRAENFLTIAIQNPLTGEPGRMLQHKPNGDCVYLGETGCTIHGRAPAICQEFDCRKIFARFNRRQRKDGLAKNFWTQDILDAAHRLLFPAAAEETKP